MSRVRATNVPQLIATAALSLACSSNVKNLGNDIGTDGLFANTGGSTAIATETGGGAAVDGGSSTAYVLDPTLPIDPTCTCETSDKICNAARECVPRCDDAGHCARWLAPQAVVHMLVDGNTLFYAVAAETDPLGNSKANGALYRVDTAAGPPVLVASALGDPYQIVGRRNGTTYVLARETFSAGSLVAVADDGRSATIAEFGISHSGSDASMRGHWIAFASRDGSALMGIDLDSGSQPVVLAQPPPESSGTPAVSLPLVLDDVVVYSTLAKDNLQQVCELQLSNPTLPPVCDNAPFATVRSSATVGDQYYLVAYSGVMSFAPPAKYLLSLQRF